MCLQLVGSKIVPEVVVVEGVQLGAVVYIGGFSYIANAPKEFDVVLR